MTPSARARSDAGMLRASAFASLKIDHRFKFGRCLNGKVARSLATQDAVDIARRPAPLVVLIGPIGEQSALGCEVPKRIDCRQTVSRMIDPRFARV